VSGAALLIARHAPVAVEGICYGQSDVPTTVDAGAASAILLEQLVRDGTRVARVWTSPWHRTRSPSTLVAAALRVPIVVDARLSELAFGEWEGRAYAELEGDARFGAWMRNWQSAAPPGGERLSDLVERVRAWRTDVLSCGEAALAVTHAGVVRVLRAESRGVAYAAVMQERVDALVIEPIPSEAPAPV
jgi:alpha-ribazole phosphatase